MRNLRQYPITLEEKYTLLDELIKIKQLEMAQSMVCGDMTVTLLMDIKNDLKLLYDHFLKADK